MGNREWGRLLPLCSCVRDLKKSAINLQLISMRHCRIAQPIACSKIFGPKEPTAKKKRCARQLEAAWGEKEIPDCQISRSEGGGRRRQIFNVHRANLPV